MAFLAELAGVFGETAVGVTIGALRAAAAAGEIGESDRVVALVTGTGLKTPQAVAEHETGSVVEIDADVDLLLEELGVVA
jgi:threonine synthase